MSSKYTIPTHTSQERVGAVLDAIDDAYDDAFGAEDDAVNEVVRTVKGAGGWVYKQYPDESVEIVAAPKGYRAGRTLVAGQAQDDAFLKAIWAEIGSYSDWFKTVAGKGTAPTSAPEAGGTIVFDLPNVKADERVASSDIPRAERRRFLGFGGINDRVPANMKDDLPPRVVRGSGGYVYRQFPDESIVIEASPGQRGVGKRMTSGRAYAAVRAEIGSYSDWMRMTDTQKVALEQRALRGRPGVRRTAPRLTEAERDDLIAANLDNQDLALDTFEDDVDQMLATNEAAQRRAIGAQQPQSYIASAADALEQIGQSVAGSVGSWAGFGATNYDKRAQEHAKRRQQREAQAEYQRQLAKVGRGVGHQARAAYYEARANVQERRETRDAIRKKRELAEKRGRYGAFEALEGRLPSERFAVKNRKAVTEIVEWLGRHGVEARPLSDGTEFEAMILSQDVDSITRKLNRIARKYDLDIQSGQGPQEGLAAYTFYFEPAGRGMFDPEAGGM